MRAEDHLHVERLGGLAGMGGPGAHLRSVGELRGSELSPAERDRLAALFGGARPAAERAGAADGFRYRLTLHRAGEAAPAVIELPEAATPERVRACVRDELV